MPKIFISYRRADSQRTTGRIHDHLAHAFGDKNVFMDIDDIPAGIDFRAYIAQEMETCDVLLVIVGDQWMSIVDEDGNPRIGNSTDLVRIEVEAGLQRDHIIVIPILVHNARMPKPEDLPESLRDLSYVNAMIVRDGRDFKRDMDGVITQIRGLSRRTTTLTGTRVPAHGDSNRGLLVAIALLVVAILIIGGVIASGVLSGGDDGSDDNVGLVTDDPTEDTEVAQQAPSETSTNEPIATDTPSAEPIVTNISSDTSTDEPTATETDTSTPTITLVPSETLTPTLSSAQRAEMTFEAASTETQIVVDATLDQQEVEAQATQLAAEAQQTSDEIATQTATQWTSTPEPTSTATETPSAMPTSSFTPIELAQVGVESNDDWEPYIQEFDGVEMVLVPAGCFLMGSEDGYSHEQPVHEQCFEEPFWIDRYEVTQQQFAEFDGQAATSSLFSGDTLPRERITWFEASSFCGLRDSRLPTEREWEYVARGPDNLVYPWGDEYIVERVAPFGVAGITSDVGSIPSGVSWVGALDMSGNVWEWVSTIFDPEGYSYPYVESDGREDLTSSDQNRVIRGGSVEARWNSFLLRNAYRGEFNPIYSNNLGGFRCALDFEG